MDIKSTMLHDILNVYRVSNQPVDLPRVDMDFEYSITLPSCKAISAKIQTKIGEATKQPSQLKFLKLTKHPVTNNQVDPLSRPSLQSLVDLREYLPGDPDPLLVLLHALVAHDHAVAEPRVVANDRHRLLCACKQCLWSVKG